MKIQGAIIKEQGATFAIVVVKKHVVDNKISANDAISNFSSFSLSRTSTRSCRAKPPRTIHLLRS